MNVITALGNKKITDKIKENNKFNIIGKDIQYQEAVIEILEKNKNINLLILSSILPGELTIKEFVNIIIYKNPNLEIIIILEKENEELERFFISKGINNIFYNNKTTLKEIFEKINDIKSQEIINQKINNLEKIILENNKYNYLNKIKSKINYLKNKNKLFKQKNKKINNKKIISIIGANKIGKSIFSLLVSLNIKNKKILLIDFDMEKNNIKKIIGKKIKNKNYLENNIFHWKKKINIMFVTKQIFEKNILNKKETDINFLDKTLKEYDYIVIDMGEIRGKEQILNRSDKIIVLVEANLLGIDDTREILYRTVKANKNQKDKIKIVFNKHSKTSIPHLILKKIFSDFEIIGKLYYSNFYNIFLNTNANFISKRINKEFNIICKKIIT